MGANLTCCSDPDSLPEPGNSIQRGIICVCNCCQHCCVKEIYETVEEQPLIDDSLPSPPDYNSIIGPAEALVILQPGQDGYESDPVSELTESDEADVAV